MARLRRARACGAWTSSSLPSFPSTPTQQLLKLPFLQRDQVKGSLHAYQLSKRANSLRVMGEAVRWGY